MFLHKVLRRKKRSFQGNPSVVGLTFLEIIISLTLISVGMLLYLEIFNTAMDAHSRSIREIISTNLAQGLMAEIMAKNFEDDLYPTNPIGPDMGPDGITEETRNGGIGYAFDDVDDYFDETTGIGYTESPGPPYMVGGLPMDGTGTRPNYAGFFRTVTGVIYVNCDVDCAPAAGATNYKQVTLQVTDPRGRVTQQVEVKVKP